MFAKNTRCCRMNVEGWQERKLQLAKVMQYLIEGQFQLPLFPEEDEDMNKKADLIERRMQRLVTPVIELMEMHDLKYSPNEELKEMIRKRQRHDY